MEKFILVHLGHHPLNHRRHTNTNHIAPPFKNGTVSHQRPPIPCTYHDVQGRSLLRRSPQLDLHYTGELATQFRNKICYAGIASVIDILDIPQWRKISIRQDNYYFFIDNSP